MPETSVTLDKRRIYVIGPMSDATGKPLKNTSRIKSALAAVMTKAGAGAFEIRVPEEQYGNDIPRDVFNAIDLSDLVVADISERSPNVMYELAFAHALGLATILVDLAPPPGTPGGRRKIFYLSQARTARVASLASGPLQKALGPFILEWLQGRSDLQADPLTNFYGASLVDISAVAGVAAGYVENFVIPIMKAINGNLPQPVARPVALVVVLPETLDQLDHQARKVGAVLAESFGADAVLSPALVVGEDAQGQSQKRTVVYVGRVVVDLPRTLFPLRRSHRFARVSRTVKDSADRALVLERMERRLIDRFTVVMRHLAEESGEVVMEQMHVVRRGDLAATVKALVQP